MLAGRSDLLTGSTRPGPPPEPGENGAEMTTETVNNEQLFLELLDRFSALAETCARFSREVYWRVGVPPQADLDRTIRRNIDIARAVFSRWTIDLLTVLYFRGTSSYPELRSALGKASTSVLTRKLNQLEGFGLVQRSVVRVPPAQSRYSLTHKGAVIARLGEPVMLYLRLSEGWSRTVITQPATP